MFYSTPTLELMQIALKKVFNKASYYFSEIEQMQNSPKSVKVKYIQSAIIALEQKIYEDLRSFKENYNYNFSQSLPISGSDTSNTFVINASNGLNNFVRGIPNFVISVCLMRDGIPFASAIGHPIYQYFALVEKGQGAFFNQRRLKITDNNILEDLNIATDINMLPTLLKQKEVTSNYLINNSPLLDILYLASNKLDMIAFSNKINFNNIAAGILLLEEAGFTVMYDKIDDNYIKNLKASRVNILELYK